MTEQTAAYSGNEQLLSMLHARNYNSFLSELALQEASEATKLLDIGAGIGLFARMMKDAGKDVVCVETDEQQLEYLRSDFEAVQSIEEIRNGEYKFAYCMNVLEHVREDVKMLAEIRSKLVPNGKLLIYVPALPFLYSSMDRAVGHFRRYTRSSLRSAITNAGFQIQSLHYADSLGVGVSLLYKYLGGNSGRVRIAPLWIYDRMIFPVSRLLDRGLLQNVIGKNLAAVCVNADR
ncbi:class I SAM-dependent methyltransferase [bacterium]|nr:class I SAM-dependent methyltransferase [bacterium]MBU1637554.1 class I SAM-dependent methyltransferase [bacterium]